MVLRDTPSRPDIRRLLSPAHSPDYLHQPAKVLPNTGASVLILTDADPRERVAEGVL